MIFALQTSDATCNFALLDAKGVVYARHAWEAGRSLAQDLLRHIDDFLEEHNHKVSAIEGIVVFKGPGSFTSLRIGCTVMNTYADVLQVPIVGMTGDEWLSNGYERIQKGDNDQIIVPEYGSLPTITLPRK